MKLFMQSLLGLFLFLGCASKSVDDPLKNSKKLIIEGHKSLYDNGAISIPFTTLKLIPAGPRPLEIAKELVGLKAKASFHEAVRKALESVYIIPGGSKYAYDLSKKIFHTSVDLANDMRDTTRQSSIWLIHKSSKIAKKYITGALAHGLESAKLLYNFGDSIEAYLYKNAKRFARRSDKQANNIYRATVRMSEGINDMTTELADDMMIFSKERFIQGYAVLPKKLEKHFLAMKKSLNGQNFKSRFKQANLLREQGSVYFSNIFGNSLSEYGSNIGDSFSKAKHALVDNIEKDGLILSSLKSMRWAIHAILYNGIIEPLAKISYASVGYISSNGIIFPIHLLVNEGLSVAEVAVEISFNTLASVYDIVAPTAVSAVAGILGSGEYMAGKVVSGAAYVTGSTLSGAQRLGGHVVSAAAHTSGFLAGKTIKYIGVPLAATGVTIGDTTYGVVASTGMLASSATLFGTGEVASLGTKAFGNLLSAATLTTGTVASVAAASTVGAYQLSKAVVVPSAYTLTSGTVLSYGTLSHLSAHAILAVSDAAYMVLSLEGPRWVLYAVSGRLKGSEELPVGAVLDLKKMQEKGEEIRYVPVSDQEMSKVVHSVYENLPRIKD